MALGGDRHVHGQTLADGIDRRPVTGSHGLAKIRASGLCAPSSANHVDTVAAISSPGTRTV
jgi:hypothetical protein